MTWKLETLGKELRYDIDSTAKALDELGKLAAAVDAAVGCGKGYVKRHWLSAEQMKELMSSKQANEITRVLSINLPAFSDIIKQERDELEKMYKEGIVDEEKLKSEREWICDIVAQLAYLAAQMQYIVYVLGGR